MRKHVIITGTGRTGTTFLVKLLDYLGFDIGMSTHTMWFCEESCCGLEYDVRKHNAPYICKDPRFCDYAEEALNDKDIKIKHVLIPIRNLFEAAESRRCVSKMNITYGGLWDTFIPRAQEVILMEKLYTLLLSLSSRHIPITFINYPKLTEDVHYLYNKLEFLLNNIKKAKFDKAFKAIVRRDYVHYYA